LPTGCSAKGMPRKASSLNSGRLIPFTDPFLVIAIGSGPRDIDHTKRGCHVQRSRRGRAHLGPSPLQRTVIECARVKILVVVAVKRREK
jgi:hypothetical protein